MSSSCLEHAKNLRIQQRVDLSVLDLFGMKSAMGGQNDRSIDGT